MSVKVILIYLLVKKDTNHVWKQFNNWVQEVRLKRKPNCFGEVILFEKRWLSIFKEIIGSKDLKKLLVSEIGL